MAKTNLLNLNREGLRNFFKEMGEKPFRADQVMKWIYQHGISDFEEMSNLNKNLRAMLIENCEIKAPEIAYFQEASDGTIKFALTLEGGQEVESVWIPETDRATLCVSSQVGCALECTFCSTAQQGFNRNLSVSEIIGQVWRVATFLGLSKDSSKRPITNVVMMGMGEPLLNYKPVVGSMELMLSDHAYGLSKRRVTLSTSGVVPKMYQLAQDIDVALAISLHAPNDELRNELVPINKKYPLEELIAAAKNYVYDVNPRHKKHVTIEYVMLDGVNDSNEHAHQLVVLLEGLPSKINLIPFNPFPHASYDKSSNNRIHAFSNILSEAGFVCTIRQTRGDDIDAACGQLVGQVADRTRRSAAWQQSIKDRENV